MKLSLGSSLVVVGIAALGLATVFGSGGGVGRRAAARAASVGAGMEEAPGEARAELESFRELVPPTASVRGGSAPAPEREERIASSAALEEELARLRELARVPETFHRKAWPVIEELTSISTRLPVSAQEGALARADILDAVLTNVVHDSGASPLVRGAAFLGLAPALTEARFAETFSRWMSGDPELPLELVRAAALSAARRGNPSPCASRSSLAQLAALSMHGEIRLPGIHPMPLAGCVAPIYGDSIRFWLDTDDPRRAILTQVSSSPVVNGEALELADYFATSEVLFCVWAMQSLVDPAVEARLIAEALMLSGETGPPPFLRAAGFMVRSLALCSTGLYEAAAKASASGDALVAAIARELERGGIGGLSLGLASRIESLRYSPAAADEAELVRILLGVGRGLEHADPEDAERSFTLGYLQELVSDVAVSPLARATAMSAIADQGSWPELRAAARLAVRRTEDETLAAVALNSIVAWGEGHREVREEALGLLRELEANVPSRLQRSVDQYIARLDR